MSEHDIAVLVDEIRRLRARISELEVGIDNGYKCAQIVREQTALLREAITMIEKYRMGFAPEYEMSIAFTEHVTAALGSRDGV